MSITILFLKFSFAQQKINFPSKDGLLITADHYKINDISPVIILCHQAGYSRGEYLETAKELNKLGFNCIAVDQRTGGVVNGIKNETAALAKSKNKPSNYIDAEQDIIAVVDYAFQLYKKRVILFGSSYSASLALKIGKENEKVAAVIAFSPGEYFDNLLNVGNTIAGLDKPVYATSSKAEAASVMQLLMRVKSSQKVQYLPKGEGIHASRALWKDSPDNQEYWTSLKSFLASIKNVK